MPATEIRASRREGIFRGSHLRKHPAATFYDIVRESVIIRRLPIYRNSSGLWQKKM